jgi:hypothetical protein
VRCKSSDGERLGGADIARLLSSAELVSSAIFSGGSGLNTTKSLTGPSGNTSSRLRREIQKGYVERSAVSNRRVRDAGKGREGLQCGQSNKSQREDMKLGNVTISIITVLLSPQIHFLRYMGVVFDPSRLASWCLRNGRSGDVPRHRNARSLLHTRVVLDLAHQKNRTYWDHLPSESSMGAKWLASEA